MAAPKTARRRTPPRPERPHFPGYGPATGRKGLLPWQWAERCLPCSRNYWIVTVRPTGAPHAMPVWGIWMEGTFYFSTGVRSRKARNLARHARCVVCTERAEDAVIVEGTARIVHDREVPRRIAGPYRRKYEPWRLDPAPGPVFAVRPKVAFGLIENQFVSGATKWVF